MDPKALGQFLMQPSTADVLNTPVRRGGILPVTEYPNRSEFDLSSGLTGALMNAFTAPARAARGEISEDQQIPEAFNFAGSLTLGSLLAPRPTGSVGMGGRAAKEALDMSEAARMARAKDMGFDTGTVLHHGTDKKFDAFDVGKAGSKQYSDWGKGVYLTPSKSNADYYRVEAVKKASDAYNQAFNKYQSLTENVPVKNGVPQYSDDALAALDDFRKVAAELDKTKEGYVGEYYIRAKKPYILPYQSTPDPTLAARAAELGHDAIYVMDGAGGLNEVVMLDPSNIRSVNAAFDPDKAHLANLLAANAKTGAAVPLATKALEAQQPQGIRAFHGSPHDFDRFSMDAIGTGEGAQAYGHGLYFAEAEDVAKAYRDTLSKSPAIDANPIFNRNLKLKNSTGSKALDDALSNALGDVDLAKADLNKTLASRPDSDLPFWVNLHEQNVVKAKEALAALDELEKSGRMGPMSPGHMYEVNIKANPEDFLDWDKPLSEQSYKVREAALGIRNKAARAEYEARGFTEPLIQEYLANATRADKTGGQIVQGMKGAGQSGDFSQALREAGIPGIRYLDQMSRGEGKGSSNYVVFDDNLIEILRKYGLLGPVAGGGTLAGMLMGGQEGETY